MGGELVEMSCDICKNGELRIFLHVLAIAALGWWVWWVSTRPRGWHSVIVTVVVVGRVPWLAVTWLSVALVVVLVILSALFVSIVISARLAAAMVVLIVLVILAVIATNNTSASSGSCLKRRGAALHRASRSQWSTTCDRGRRHGRRARACRLLPLVLQTNVVVTKIQRRMASMATSFHHKHGCSTTHSSNTNNAQRDADRCTVDSSTTVIARGVGAIARAGLSWST